MECRVCASSIEAYSLSLPAPGLSSLTTPIDAPTEVALCKVCGHAQGPEPVELAAFYDSDYKISLQSDDFDQLYRMVDGKPEYRTERQLGVLLGLMNISDGMEVLDYGAAKAQSLQRLIAAKPGIVPHVFDVSRDYQGHWANFLPAEQTATYTLPDAWAGKFDLITTYFVLEHVSQPTEHLKHLRTMLKDDGRVFVMVPDALTNTGDLLVIDHVNHFTPASLRKACALAGLEIEAIDETGFTGAVAVVARRSEHTTGPDAAAVSSTIDGLTRACALWQKMQRYLDQEVVARDGKILAVHGAGFYGSFVMQRLASKGDIRFILDANPHLQGGTFCGKPVVAPHALPSEVDAVIVALNPAVARKIVADGSLYGRPGVDLVFLDSAAETST